MRINSDECCDLSQELEDLFKALSNVNRLLLIYSLAGEKGTVNVSKMAKIMGVSQPAASQHLKILKTADILQTEKKGNHIYYTFNHTALIRHKEKVDFLFGCVLAKCNEKKD